MSESTDRTHTFVADVAHDLQSPLTGMRTQLEFALSRSRSDAQEEWLRSMLAATTEMQLLVSDLLALAAEERHDLPPPRDMVDLEAIVRHESDRPRPDSSVTINVDEVGPMKVRGDETSLRRLVRNLVDNAVRHATSMVRLQVRYVDQFVVIDVMDDGPGVPDEHRERIFDRFYRADTNRGAGTGLGLAIVRQAAERHGGTVAMPASEPGVGGHFRVWLPIPD